MTFDEIATLIGQRLGSRPDLKPKIINEMRFVQEFTLERGPVKPWFLLAEASLQTVKDVQTVNLPSDFLQEYEDGGLFVYTTGESQPYRELKKGFMAELLEGESRLSNADVGGPLFYAIRGTKIHLLPTPDKVYDLRLFAYQKQPLPDDGATSNLWSTEAGDVLLAAAGRNVARHIQHNDQAQMFDQEYVMAMKRLSAENTAREAINAPTLADSSLGLGVRRWNDTDQGV